MFIKGCITGNRIIKTKQTLNASNCGPFFGGSTCVFCILKSPVKLPCPWATSNLVSASRAPPESETMSLVIVLRRLCCYCAASSPQSPYSSLRPCRFIAQFCSPGQNVFQMRSRTRDTLYLWDNILPRWIHNSKHRSLRKIASIATHQAISLILSKRPLI